MLLCDDIIFWYELRQMPVIEPDSFDEKIFTLTVDVSIMQIEVVRALIGETMKKLVSELVAIHKKEGLSGVRRWLEKVKG
jgi:hypothetical protein